MEVGQADRPGATTHTANGAGPHSPWVTDDAPAATFRPFEVHSEQIDPHACRVAICGELDRATVPQVEATLRPIADEKLVLIDLSECDFIDSTGLALIVEAWRKLAGDGVQVALCGPSGHVEKMLDLTGVKASVAVFGSLDEALARSQCS